jgi:signal transduction histidine kinase
VIVRKRRQSETSTPAVSTGGTPWKVLIVDDEPDVHQVTELALGRMSFEGRGLEFLHAYRGAEALEIIRGDPDVAVMLLDVVMETEHDGLDVCRVVRNDFHNELLRIVLRTGQPGAAPEREVIESYDIDDYREKTDLSSEKLFTCVRLALKGYQDLAKLQALYDESLALQRATQKVMNHLSHELRTPLAILRGVISAIRGEVSERMRSLLQRGERNLLRLIELHQQIQDIFRGGDGRASDLDPVRFAHKLLLRVAEEAKTDPVLALEALNAKLEDLRDLIEAPHGPDDRVAVHLSQAIPAWVDAWRADFAHRSVALLLRLPEAVSAHASPRILEQAIGALFRNAVENTPDGGVIEISAVREPAGGVRVTVADRGVGITQENQRFLFSGFFHTQATELYSSKRPYDFDAGGKGLELLRLKVWSKRFGWKLDFESQRCVHIPTERDVCPGDVAHCPHISSASDCEASGGSVFRLLLPSAEAEGG